MTVVEKVPYGSCAMTGYLVKIYPEETKDILSKKKKKNHLQRFLGVYLYCVSSPNYKDKKKPN